MKARLFVVALAAALPSHAQVYKCTDGGKVAYSEAPCERGTQSVMPAPAAPMATPGPAELERVKRESRMLQHERERREALQDRLDAAHDRQAARRREQCAKLEQARKWADEDVRRATHHTVDAARLKAKRAAERHAAACR